MTRAEGAAAPRRPVAALLLAAAFVAVATSCFSTLIVLAAGSLAPSPRAAGIPYALYFVVLAAATFLNARLAHAIGRKIALIAALATGAGGAVLMAAAFVSREFGVLVVGAALFGYMAGAATSMRLFATELVPAGSAMTLVSAIMGMGLIGGITGPMVALAGGPTARGATAAFAIVAGVLLLAALAMSQLPRARAADVGGPGRFRLVVTKDRKLLAAGLASALAWTIMIAFMGTGPARMHATGIGDTAVIVSMQSHFIGMFGPAILTPYLLRFVTRRALFLIGLGCLFGSAVVGLFAAGALAYWATLALCGVGWGMTVVISSTVIGLNATGPDKFAVQGMLDLITYSGAAIAALSSGWVVATTGWTLVAATSALLVVAYLLCFRDRAVAQS